MMEDNVSVARIFESMEYGPIVEASALAKVWLDNKSRKLSSFINGEYTPSQENSSVIEVKDYHSSQLLASVAGSTEADVEHALKSSCTALERWIGLTPYVRARHLYNIARHVQQHATLLAQMEALVRGVQIRDARDCDVPGVIRTFYHNAGWAQLAMNKNDCSINRGVTVGITSQVTPLQALAWLVAPALASGCTLILKPSRQTSPVALLLAEICNDAGLPPGVLNVVTGDNQTAQQLAAHASVSKVFFFGSTKTGKLIREDIAGLGKSITMVMSSRTPMIVLESADLDSACEAVIESAWFNQGQVPWAVTDLYVQQSVFETFCKKLATRMQRLKVGHNFDKMADVGYPCDTETAENVRNVINKYRSQGARVLTITEASLPSPCRYLVPAVVVGASIESNVLMDDDWPLPVVMLNPFRTAKEAASLANNSKYSLASSIWTQDFSVAEEIAQSLKVGTVWINCVNKFDAGVPFGATRQSGIGRIGGKEGMLEYLIPASVAQPCMNFNKKCETGCEFCKCIQVEETNKPVEYKGKAYSEGRVDRTYKLYYGGGHKRPDGNLVDPFKDHQGHLYALIPDGNRKDIRNAVEAAHKAQPGWSKSGAHLRAQILFYLAENLQLRKEEFAKEFTRIMGVSEKFAVNELDKSVECLFFWASVCDKGLIAQCQPPPLAESKATVSISYEPHGVIGICINTTHPLLYVLSVVAPAIALGNTVIVVPSDHCPLPVFWLCQVADTSDLPAGVINVISGNMESLGVTLANHHDVDALWCFGMADNGALLDALESFSCGNMKPFWSSRHCKCCRLDYSQEHYHTNFFYRSTLSKALWKPIGGMFGN